VNALVCEEALERIHPMDRDGRIVDRRNAFLLKFLEQAVDGLAADADHRRPVFLGKPQIDTNAVFDGLAVPARHPDQFMGQNLDRRMRPQRRDVFHRDAVMVAEKPDECRVMVDISADDLGQLLLAEVKDRGLPDGSTVDAEGYLWNCRFYGGCIVRVAPDGKIDCIIDMPVKNITTCTFGGTDRKTLYVTTASLEAGPGDRLAGGLYAVQCEASGQAENRFHVVPY